MERRHVWTEQFKPSLVETRIWLACHPAEELHLKRQLMNDDRVGERPDDVVRAVPPRSSKLWHNINHSTLTGPPFTGWRGTLAEVLPCKPEGYVALAGGDQW